MCGIAVDVARVEAAAGTGTAGAAPLVDVVVVVMVASGDACLLASADALTGLEAAELTKSSAKLRASRGAGAGGAGGV